MVKKTDNGAGSKRMDDVLAIYGADQARWPEADRKALQSLLRSDKSVARSYREAVALEEVMAQAPAGKPTAELKQRIVTAAIADGARDARVVPISSARKRGRRGPGDGAMWPAAALAASFAFGLYLGVAGLGAVTVSQAMEMAALGTIVTDAEADDVVFGGDGGDQEGLL